MTAGRRFSVVARRAMFALVAASVVALALSAVLLGVGYVDNNADTAAPTAAELLASRDRAAAWIRANEDEIIAGENPALWWMLRESATLSGDAYLGGLYVRYYGRYLAQNPNNVWHHLFDHESPLRISVDDLDGFPDYNLLFLYGLSCQSVLRGNPGVRRLLRDDACPGVGTPAYFRDPACLTHQVMGIRFLQRGRCEDGERTVALLQALQAKVALQAAWDPRVVDFYIQRVLMLAESDAAGRIQPRWVRRIIDAQRADGGWDDFAPLAEVDAGRAIGWGGRGLRLLRPASNFHTTAQGLYLMSLLAAAANNPAKPLQ
jgi:hypothetical protein